MSREKIEERNEGHEGRVSMARGGLEFANCKMRRIYPLLVGGGGVGPNIVGLLSRVLFRYAFFIEKRTLKYSHIPSVTSDTTT